MKDEELIRKLESVKLPEIELENYRCRLKNALLNYGYSKNTGETTIWRREMARINGISDTLSGFLMARRPVWKIALTAFVIVMALFITLFSIPQTSAIMKSTFFPEGTRTIGGPQLSAEEQEKAMNILMADPRVREILSQGAVIDKLLPIQVEAEKVNPETGNSEIIRETWAQAWLICGDKDWGVQIDLVKGQVVSITP